MLKNGKPKEYYLEMDLFNTKWQCRNGEGKPNVKQMLKEHDAIEARLRNIN